MAYVPTFQSEDEKNTNSSGNISVPSGPSTVLSSGQSGTVGSGSGNSGDASKRAAGGGTGFVNFQKYLKANEGNDLADKTSQSMISQGSDATDKLTGVDTTFKTLADKDDLSFKGTADGTALGTVAKGQAVYGDDRSNFERYKNAQYSGPQSLAGVDGYDDAASAKDKALKAFKNSESYEGRLSLLNDTFGRPNYSKGQQKLDQALLQGDRQASQKLADARTQFKDLGTNFDTALTNSQDYAQQRVSRADQMKEQALDALRSGQTSLRQRIEGARNSKQQQLENQRAAELADARKLYTRDDLSDYGYDFNSYAGGEVPMFTLNDVASQGTQYRAAYDILNELGMGANFLSPEAQAARNLGLSDYFDESAAMAGISKAEAERIRRNAERENNALNERRRQAGLNTSNIL